MNELTDIQTCIISATHAGNFELAKFWIRWQLQRNSVPMDDVVLSAVQAGDLEIPRILGTPGPGLAEKLVVRAVEIGFLEAVEWGFQYLSDAGREMILTHYDSSTLPQRAPGIGRFLLRARVEGRSALIPAVKVADIARVKWILSSDKTGDLVNLLTTEGTPLGIAVAFGHFDLIRFFLSVPGIDPLMPDLNGESPFVLACRYAQSPVWRLFLDSLGDALIYDSYEVNTGFFRACSRDLDVDFELSAFFSQFPVLDPNFQVESQSAFLVASVRKNVSLLRWLLTLPGVNVNDRDGTGSTGAILASGLGIHAAVQLLLNDSRVDLEITNCYGASALSAACGRGYLTIVQSLLGSRRIDLRVFGARALSQAIVRGCTDVVHLLLAHPDLDVNASAMPSVLGSPLFTAANSKPRTGLPGQFVNQIVTHPSFDRSRNDISAAIFASIRNGLSATFAALLGDDLTIRGPAGESLTAAIIAHHQWGMLKHLLTIPGFDPARCDVTECLAAVAKVANVDTLTALGSSGSIRLRFLDHSALAKLPALDLNARAPHGVNGFPDRASFPRVKRLTEDVPLVFSWVRLLDNFWTDVDPRFDLNRRGKHGETLLFARCARVPEVPGIDINAIDRHGNTACVCHLLSVAHAAVSSSQGVKCDQSIRNENGDTLKELVNARMKRAAKRERRQIVVRPHQKLGFALTSKATGPSFHWHRF
jgi:ankyrin repeat protein